MKQSTLFLLVVLLTTYIYSSITAQELSEPEKNFEHLWKTFDMNYAIFDAKKVDWQAIYKVYRPQVTPETTDDELFNILSNMLGHLNDNHVRLSTQNPNRYFSAGYLFEHFGKEGLSAFSEMMSQRPVPEKYFKEKLKESDNKVFGFGWANDSIAYFHFRGFGNIEKSTEIIDMIIQEFKDAKAIIVDVRRNGGGDDRVGKLIADRFADRKRLYMTTQIRNGKEHNDFTPKKYWYVEPDGPIQFTKQVVLLTDRTSISAAENFALAMRVLPHVTVIGDFTSGCFADVYGDRLPNGWQFGCSYKLFLDHTGFCWEGIGVPADIRQTNSKQDIENGRDRVMDLAIALINTNALKLQEESSSLQNIRESLVEILVQEIDHKNIESAIKKFRNHKSRDPNAYYIDMDELNALGQRLLATGKAQEAIEVFKISIEEFPNSIVGYENLADAYLEVGDTKQAKDIYKKSMEINRRSYPWEKELYIMAERVVAGAMILHKVLERTTDENAIKKVVENYHRNPTTYYVVEGQVNRLGYKYLNEEKVLEAIEVFKINVKEFPESWNVYDSLGEAYMVNGDKELAIKNYEKSVELNPNNRGGINALKKLKEQ
jgi:carboxyl-terminal processing protease